MNPMSVLSKSTTSRGARALLLASATALVMSSVGAQAAPAVARQTPAAPQATAAGDSDFSARKRYRRGNAAGLAMMGLMVGTVGSVIAAQQRREAYDRAYATRPAYVQYPRYGYQSGYTYRGGYASGPAYGVQGYRAPPVQNPGHAVGHYTNPYDDPNLARLNAQTPNTTNYGPPRIGSKTFFRFSPIRELTTATSQGR